MSLLLAPRTRRSRRWSSGLITKDFNSNDPHDPLVVQDKVIVGTDKGQLRAYRCKDGNSIWVHEHGARIFHRPCSDGQRIYFSSAKGLTAVKVEDGTEVWRFDLACCDGPSLVLAKQGTVFVGGNDGNLYALDAKTGKQVWASDFIADAPPDPPNFSGERARMTNTKARPSSLASDGETLFLSVFDQCRIVAVNATDGKRLWSFQTGGWVYGSAVATENHVFVGSQDKVFYCLDKRTGRKVWSHQTKGRIESGGAVDDKFVYFGSCDGGVYCLNQSDGQARWRFATDQQGWPQQRDLFSSRSPPRRRVLRGRGRAGVRGQSAHGGVEVEDPPIQGVRAVLLPGHRRDVFFRRDAGFGQVCRRAVTRGDRPQVIRVRNSRPLNIAESDP